MEDKITEKVYCYDHPSAYKTNDNGMCYAMMANQNNMNNPMWLVWMMAMRWMYGGNGYGDGYGANGYAALQGQIADNQNVNNILRELTQNQNAMADIANRTNTSIDFVRNSLCQLGSAIQRVEGETKFSAERIVNSVLSGEANVISKLQQCCCDNKLLVTQQGYETRLAMKDQTYQINERLTGIANGIQQGFSAVAYESQRQTCDVINSGKDNTQRIIDVLNNHWQADLQQRYNDARLELSQKTQNEYLINQLKGNHGCGCGV